MARAKQNQTSSKTISVEWLYGIPPEDKDDFAKSWANSTHVLDKLKGIIERQLKVLDVDKEDDYNNPNWPLARADKNGQIRVLRKIFNLLP